MANIDKCYVCDDSCMTEVCLWEEAGGDKGDVMGGVTSVLWWAWHGLRCCGWQGQCFGLTWILLGVTIPTKFMIWAVRRCNYQRQLSDCMEMFVIYESIFFNVAISAIYCLFFVQLIVENGCVQIALRNMIFNRNWLVIHQKRPKPVSFCSPQYCDFDSFAPIHVFSSSIPQKWSPSSSIFLSFSLLVLSSTL